MLCVLMPFLEIKKMFSVSFDFEHKKWCFKKWCYAKDVINECITCESSNQRFLNVKFSYLKAKDELFMT